MSTQHLVPSMRRVRYSADAGAFVSNHALCTYCGDKNVCQLSTTMQKVWEGLPGKQHSCRSFKPIIVFRNPHGIGGEFNTIRLGLAWAKRVERGTIVTLYDSKRELVIGDAEVTAVHSGDKSLMVTRHAEHNHGMRHSGLKGYAASSVLLRTLRMRYGKMIFDSQPDCTVIYLRRIQH